MYSGEEYNYVGDTFPNGSVGTLSVTSSDKETDASSDDNHVTKTFTVLERPPPWASSEYIHMRIQRNTVESLIMLNHQT